MQLHTPEEMAVEFAARVRAERLRLGLKQQTLADRAGVSLPTVRRYERTGKVSFQNLLRLCHALGRLDDFAGLLCPPRAATLAELEERHATVPKRKRGIR
jgi:transcriptional regulator with XRE-family HTH domain